MFHRDRTLVILTISEEPQETAKRHMELFDRNVQTDPPTSTPQPGTVSSNMLNSNFVKVDIDLNATKAESDRSNAVNSNMVNTI